MSRVNRSLVLRAGTLCALGTLAGCVLGPTTATRASGRVHVVAAENVWGSLVAQIAGTKADVTSIVTNPATDPHDYEPKPRDAREIASARYVVVNGIGYDGWARKLLDVESSHDRVVLDVGKLVGVQPGGNPHQWYSPTAVRAVVRRVENDLARVDPPNARYYEHRLADLETTGLHDYDTLIAEIRVRFAGVAIGASESVVTPLADALALRVATPASFLDAISEGNDPGSSAKAIVDRQIARRDVAVFVFNPQNATPDVRRLVDAARSRRIPVVQLTETLTPAGATFRSWQTRQLRALRDALAESSVTRR
jgi:zinc/manganese transport system substrate-binding protein